MPLTPSEIAFLGPAMAEYADVRNGPAWRALRERGVKYTDIVWLMEAYQIADPPRLTPVTSSEGTASEVLAFGRETNALPECPWPDAEAARTRNDELEAEVEAFRSAHGKDAGE